MIPQFGLAWRLARRELRSGLGGFAVFLACLTLGVAAIAAVGVINAGVLDGVKRDASALLGGDLRFDSTNLPIEEAELATLAPADARRTDIVRTNAMVHGPDDRRVVVALKAVDDAYPLYGEVRHDPPSIPLDDALAEGGAVVERGLLSRLGLAIGDQIRIGAAEFVVRAVVEREPDRIGGFISIGPRVLIHLDQLARTETILPGSLARYSYRFALPGGADPEAMLDRLRAENPDSRWRVRGPREIQPRITHFTDHLASYLTLAGMSTLLIGGVGVALAIQHYLAAKTTAIATLKCLGASGGLVFRMYLLQVLALASLGVLLGLLIGQSLPWLLSFVLQDILPVQIATGIYPMPLLLAASCGFLTALTFAIWPLSRARTVSAAGMFRALIMPPTRWPPAYVVALLASCIAGLAALAVLGVADRRSGLWFVAIALASAIVLAGLARLLLFGIGLVRARGSTRLRLALANLGRPGAHAASVIVALGAGLTALTMVALLERNLAAEVELRLPERVPGVFFIDIQRDQLARFEAAVAAFVDSEMLQTAPIIRGRVVRIAGVPVAETGIAHWTLRHDRGLSYAAAEPAGTELVAGEWWPEDYAGPPLVSVEDEVAAAYDVGVGDRLTFNVLGRVIEVEIANLRAEIDWGRGRLDFVFLFSPGVLEAAPHTFAAAVDVTPAEEPALLDAIAQQLPNVTPISVRELVAQVGEVLNKIRIAVAAVAAVTLLSGLLVLAGAVAAARRRHLYESVVLKVLGARRRDLLQVFALEYLSLGSAAALAGALLGSLGAFAIVTWVMELTWTFAAGAVVTVAALALALTLIAGFTGTWRLLGRPAAPVLRAP